MSCARLSLTRVLFGLAGTMTAIAIVLAGTMTAIAIVLAVTVSPWFLALGVFVAANQWLYALVGACPASVVLRRTPCFSPEVTR